jgi:L-threonylcarbamoyladenylate synthase
MQMAEIGQDINKAIQFLNTNELVGIPTETVYGLAGNALSVDAMLKIFETKNRPTFDPFIIHTHSVEAIRKYVTQIPEKAEILFAKFAPGPITILLPKNDLIHDLVTSGSNLVAVRIPNNELTLNLLKKIDFPLAAPSANPFGYISPTSAEHVNNQLGDKIPYILDGGDCEIGIESTIISFETETPSILRLGGLSVEDIENEIGKVNVNTHSTSNPKAPGMLKSHYAPKKKLLIGNIEELLALHINENIGVLSFNTFYYEPQIALQLQLSPKSSIAEAAKNLFAYLRLLDQTEQVEIIITEFLPENSLGRAINDRLKRASA